MSWYDFFSRFYDGSLEPLYRDARREAAAALRLAPSLRVLDAPTGTGQRLDELAPAVLPGGRVVGLDASSGMLARACARIERSGHSHVTLHACDVHAVNAALLESLGVEGG